MTLAQLLAFVRVDDRTQIGVAIFVLAIMAVSLATILSSAGSLAGFGTATD